MLGTCEKKQCVNLCTSIEVGYEWRVYRQYCLEHYWQVQAVYNDWYFPKRYQQFYDYLRGELADSSIAALKNLTRQERRNLTYAGYDALPTTEFGFNFLHGCTEYIASACC